jgi:hypothetical protein
MKAGILRAEKYGDVAHLARKIRGSPILDLFRILGKPERKAVGFRLQLLVVIQRD